ncbi:MAG: 30S ribosomal protein S15 [Candidatus Woesearchaeota archaeon]
MARMYSRRKGKAGSKKPLTKKMPSWVRYKSTELEMIISKMAKEGKSLSDIGMILRDTYGVPDVRKVTGKRLAEILREKKLLREMPEDIISLFRRAVAIRKHLQENKKDGTALKGLQLTEAKIGRLAKYYKRTGKIPVDWKYNPDQIKIYVE